MGIPIKLTDITKLESARARCLRVETYDGRRYLLSLKSEEQARKWLDAIHARSQLHGVSTPFNFVHNVHIGIDAVSGEFTVSQMFDGPLWLSHLPISDRACPITGNLCFSSRPRHRRGIPWPRFFSTYWIASGRLQPSSFCASSEFRGLTQSFVRPTILSDQELYYVISLSAYCIIPSYYYLIAYVLPMYLTASTYICTHSHALFLDPSQLFLAPPLTIHFPSLLRLLGSLLSTFPFASLPPVVSLGFCWRALRRSQPTEGTDDLSLSLDYMVE